ncbi:hypothetical protein SDC9_132688 [bioreactor metagenome]|uniref:Uncharacterized protein n=1 Tax=bioreactor metagenome TaxID=1076179 RepID=A0A645D8S5_9ZZZZ
MARDRAGADDCVARLRLLRGNRLIGGEYANARRCDIQTRTAPRFHNLGVAGDEEHTRFLGSLSHGLHHAAQGFQREPGLQHHCNA